MDSHQQSSAEYRHFDTMTHTNIEQPKDTGNKATIGMSSDDDDIPLKEKFIRLKRHDSWLGSHETPNPWIVIRKCALAVIITAAGMGIAIGFLVSVTWGVLSGLIFAGATFIIFFVLLIIYMKKYGDGLATPPMSPLIDRGGFQLNISANLLCRTFLMCCNNPCEWNIVGCIMAGEAGNTAKRIRKMNHGEGPEPGGVCWLGDSEFTFWHNLEEDMAPFHPNHFNAGFGGSRLIDIERHVNKLCLDWDPETVIIHAGGNDFDFADADISPDEMPERLMKLFHVIAAHPSVKRMGYFLSSRRPVYSDSKWEFMVSKHELTINAIRSSDLHDKIEIFDLREMSHPVDDFLVDRVHLNDEGHAAKAEELLPMMMKAWPPDEEIGASTTTESECSAPSKMEPLEIDGEDHPEEALV